MTAEIVHVSANLRADGGGAAHFGRLLGRALRRFAAARALGFSGLHLPDSDGHCALDGYDSFGGRQSALAAAVARRELAAPRRRFLVFDHPGPARVQGMLPAALRARYAVAILGVDVWRPLTGARGRALAGAATLLAISRTTAEWARPFLPPGSKVEIVHPGIDPLPPSGIDPGSAALLERAGRGFALAVGRLAATERYKGHDALIEAWAPIVERFPAARLVLVGDGDDRPRLEAHAKRKGLGERILFTGAVTDGTLAELYRRAALFALPSTGEGFGLVFLEAMAAGLPCVALAGTAPSEIVRDGVTGLLVPASESGPLPPDGRNALYAALAALFADPARARAMGAAGRERFEKEWTAAAFERRLEPVLERLLSPIGTGRVPPARVPPETASDSR